MNILIYKDYATLSEFVAEEIISLLKEKPDAVICMASGDTPKLTCELFTKKAKEENLDISKFFFIGLDEWVGLAPGMEGSCHYYFKKRIFEIIGLSPAQYHLFNGVAEKLAEECTEMDKIIKDKGGIDLMIVGIGMNGHIGFNEPGSSFKLLSHVIDLDETTLTVGKKYFKEPTPLQKGITIGLAHLMAAKKALLIANGIKKAPVIKKTVTDKVNNKFPASIMQQHPNGFVLVDEEAASMLDTTKP